MSLIFRRLLIGWVALWLVQSFGAVRAEVDVRSELHLAQQSNEAALRLWVAEANVARLRLEQLEKLRDLGHASWLEVAQAGVTLEQYTAWQDREQQMASYLSELSARVAGHSYKRDVHAVRISDPMSGRLIGWFEREAVPEWAAQFPVAIDPPSEESITVQRQKADELQRRVDRLIEADYDDTALELRFARFERDRAAARVDLAELKFRRAQSECDLHQVIEKNQARSRSHYWNVDTAALSQATLGVMALEAKSDGQVRLAKLICQKHQQHRAAIEQLHRKGHASQKELQAAKKAVEDAEERHNALVRRSVQLSEQASRRSLPSPHDHRADYWQQLESITIQHPTILRHLIELRRQRLSQLAASRALEAQLQLTEEMGNRLGRVLNEETREQRSNQLDQQILRARIASVQQLDTVLESEELRFVRHLAPKLQKQGAELPKWIALAAGPSALGRLALYGMVVHHADKLHRPIVYLDTHTYLVAHSVIDPVSLCLACDNESKCCSTPHVASTRLRTSARRIDMSWRTPSAAPIRLARSALVSEYDLQRICSYYCDLPGSYCPKPNLGASRLYSSYAVPVSPSRHLVRHDDWLGIRTVNDALSHTGYRKFSGLNYSGIPVYEPVINRVRQSVRYRPSFRTP